MEQNFSLCTSGGGGEMWSKSLKSCTSGSGETQPRHGYDLKAPVTRAILGEKKKGGLVEQSYMNGGAITAAAAAAAAHINIDLYASCRWDGGCVRAADAPQARRRACGHFRHSWNSPRSVLEPLAWSLLRFHEASFPLRRARELDISVQISRASS